MTEKKYAKSHRDLIVYQKSRALALEVFEMTKSFPKEETYSLTDKFVVRLVRLARRLLRLGRNVLTKNISSANLRILTVNNTKLNTG